ncbi:XdhC family protein [Kalamiella sp. sgz302252]|uniref:XdhC family protein n=1 Tax=Pantoea sp. sgz302252 TaxID=3341827 RepID=UPI0036D3C00D
MQSLNSQVMSQALSWIKQQPVWLCTVIKTWGSSPRAVGSLLVANQQGAVCGSLSGGCVEEDFIQRIRAGDYSQPTQIIRYGEGGLKPNRALPCGGSLEVLVEYLPPTARSLSYLQRHAGLLEKHGALQKKFTLPAACKSMVAARLCSQASAEQEGNQLTLKLATAPGVLIAGLSTAALFCSDFAVALGFNTLVCEHRPEVLNDYCRSLNEQVQLIRQFPARYIESQGCQRNCAVISLTHDPRIDDLTLMEAIHTDSFYIGVIGSHRSSDERRERLRTIAGFTDEQLSRIHAPIGMAIGSKTPAEIALAVMADVVLHKNRGLQTAATAAYPE